MSQLLLLQIIAACLIVAVVVLVIVLYKTKKAHKLLRNHTASQQDVERLREDFLLMLVHELRSPLSIMKGASDLILKDAQNLNKTQIEILLTQIRTSSTDMLKTINDTSDMSKIDAGKFTISKSFGSLTKILEDECDYFKTLASLKHIHIESKFDDKVPSFNFDQTRLRQVISNLLSNAIKFSPENSKVLVTTKKNQRKVEVSVADLGVGIKDDVRFKLFNRVVRHENGMQLKDVGVGLGLAITKGIVEAHGGKIWFEDNKPNGTKFIFSLPLS